MGLFGLGKKKVPDYYNRHFYPDWDTATAAARKLCSQINSGVRPIKTPPEDASRLGRYYEADDTGFVHCLNEFNGELVPHVDLGKAKRKWEKDMMPPDMGMGGSMEPRRYGRIKPEGGFGVEPYKKRKYPIGSFSATGFGSSKAIKSPDGKHSVPIGRGPGPQPFGDAYGPQFQQLPGPPGVSRHDWADMPQNQPRRHRRGSSKHPVGSILSPDGKSRVPIGNNPYSASQMGPSQHPSQQFGGSRHPSRIHSQQHPMPGQHSLNARMPSHHSNSSMQAQPAQSMQRPPRPGKIREGERLPPGVADPMATNSNHEFGHHGLRAHVSGMTMLDVQGGGGADDPRGDWWLLDEIQRLNLGGGGGGSRRGVTDGKRVGGGPESRRGEGWTHGPR